LRIIGCVFFYALDGSVIEAIEKNISIVKVPIGSLIVWDKERVE